MEGERADWGFGFGKPSDCGGRCMQWRAISRIFFLVRVHMSVVEISLDQYRSYSLSLPFCVCVCVL